MAPYFQRMKLISSSWLRPQTILDQTTTVTLGAPIILVIKLHLLFLYLFKVTYTPEACKFKEFKAKKVITFILVKQNQAGFFFLTRCFFTHFNWLNSVSQRWREKNKKLKNKCHQKHHLFHNKKCTILLIQSTWRSNYEFNVHICSAPLFPNDKSRRVQRVPWNPSFSGTSLTVCNWTF